MRVIAGQYRSRPLHSLRGLDLRPTADRLRETLFNVLSAGNPATFHDSLWLDLCAGTGAVGIEALSRGAARVYFVESSPPAVSLIRRNLRSLGLENAPGAGASAFQVVEDDVVRTLGKLEAGGVRADFIYLDPPYRMEKTYLQILRLLSQSRLLGPKTIFIAEHDKRFEPGNGLGLLQRYRKLIQGDAALSFYRLSQ